MSTVNSKEAIFASDPNGFSAEDLKIDESGKREKGIRIVKNADGTERQEEVLVPRLKHKPIIAKVDNPNLPEGYLQLFLRRDNIQGDRGSIVRFTYTGINNPCPPAKSVGEVTLNINEQEQLEYCNDPIPDTWKQSFPLANSAVPLVGYRYNEKRLKTQRELLDYLNKHVDFHKADIQKEVDHPEEYQLQLDMQEVIERSILLEKEEAREREAFAKKQRILQEARDNLAKRYTGFEVNLEKRNLNSIPTEKISLSAQKDIADFQGSIESLKATYTELFGKAPSNLIKNDAAKLKAAIDNKLNESPE